jgi:hypothetical protein
MSSIVLAGAFAVQNGDVADALHEGRATRAAELADGCIACLAVADPEPDLEELVMIESAVELGDDGSGDPLHADVDDRLEGVGAASELTQWKSL